MCVNILTLVPKFDTFFNTYDNQSSGITHCKLYISNIDSLSFQS